jgi:hypothetical protein
MLEGFSDSESEWYRQVQDVVQTVSCQGVHVERAWLWAEPPATVYM